MKYSQYRIEFLEIQFQTVIDLRRECLCNNTTLLHVHSEYLRLESNQNPLNDLEGFSSQLIIELIFALKTLLKGNPAIDLFLDSVRDRAGTGYWD